MMFWWFIISFRGAHCGYSPKVPKNLVTPLHVMIVCMASEHRPLFMTISLHTDSCSSRILLVCLRQSESMFSDSVLSFIRFKGQKICHSLLQAQCDCHRMHTHIYPLTNSFRLCTGLLCSITEFTDINKTVL